LFPDIQKRTEGGNQDMLRATLNKSYKQHASSLTFAGLAVGLKGEASRTTAAHPGGRVLAGAIATSIVHRTGLWVNKHTGWDRQRK